MTKAQALQRYGEPKKYTVTDEGEQWIYILNTGEIIGKAFIPFNFKPTLARTGVLIFGTNGKVKKFNWDADERMKIFAAMTIAVATIASSASARIGETWKEIEARDGGAIGGRTDDLLGNSQFGFNFKDMIVIVSFVDGRSACEEFVKNNIANRLSADETRTILNANLPAGATWKSKNEMCRKSGDDHLVAVVGAHLQISTKDYAEKLTAFTSGKTPRSWKDSESS